MEESKSGPIATVCGWHFLTYIIVEFLLKLQFCNTDKENGDVPYIL